MSDRFTFCFSMLSSVRLACCEAVGEGLRLWEWLLGIDGGLESGMSFIKTDMDVVHMFNVKLDRKLRDLFVGHSHHHCKVFESLVTY